VADKNSNILFTANYVYGVSAFQTSSTDADLGVRMYTHDALGEVTAYSDANSQSFSVTYDKLSRPLVRTEPDLTTAYTWGNTASLYNIGKLQSVTAAGSVGTYTDAYSYDSKTRMSVDSRTLPGDTTYTYTWSYSPTTGFLNTLQYPLSTPSYQLSLQYGYTYGILNSITDTQAGTVYWTANTTNPRGQVTKETLGNGVVANRTYDAVTGWVGAIQAGVGSGAALQNGAFLYDDLGDVIQRQDNNQGLTENFYYDTDYRLDHSTLNSSTNLQMTYDSGQPGPGNITARSDVAGGSAWTYDPIRKHAVTLAGTGGYAYTYDGNGNATSRNSYTIGWTSYNYPSSVSSSGESATFQYGPDRQRWKTVYTGSVGTENTYHVGKLLEKVANNGLLDYRHYIFAGNELVGIYSRQSSGINTMRYVLEDHQASFASIVSSTGSMDVNASFTAYGNRRNGETWSGAPSTADENAINSVSRQGYTGQTALGVSMGLNHMNGRIQDAITGRFLSPDPYVPEPGNTQSFNRYSYVNNNPLSLVDPTGFDDDQPPMDPINVTCCSSPTSAEPEEDPGSVVGAFAAYQNKIDGAGLYGVTNLQPNGSSLNNMMQVRNPGYDQVSTVAADGTITPLDPDAPLFDPILVTSSGYSWVSSAGCGLTIDCGNLQAFSRGATQINMGRAITQFLNYSISGALGVRGAMSVYSMASAAFAAEATPLIFRNAANGQAFEQSVVSALGVAKNTASISVDGLGTSIPDLIDEFGNVTEIKSGVNLSFTNQLQIQAQGSQGSFSLIVGPNTQYISGPLQNAVFSSGGSIQVFDPAAGIFTPW